ncbi:hypothetical protein PF011_g10774 [Phytophthora fragariae]|uniref:Jacalin-type lectin domain-containing protein n=1 Tax=Phytophthora fragariae TaxID=53985 RepID=A0A6A3KLK9_9STRA|nr:hypothetical protein PF011_g10774 [Phytophthora fragariae]
MALGVPTMIIQAIFCLLLVDVPGTLSADVSVQLSKSFGGPHGTEFSDQASVSAGQTIGSITIRAGERVDGIALEVKSPKAATFSHGGSDGRANTLTLAADEYITSMEAHWGEKKGRTRIFYLSFGTSAGNSVSGGSQTDSKNTVKAPEGFQLGGFFGQGGAEIDKLGAIWTRISAEAPATEAPAPAAAPAPAPATSTSGSSSAASSSSAEASVADSSAGSTDASEATSMESSTDVSESGPASAAATTATKRRRKSALSADTSESTQLESSTGASESGPPTSGKAAKPTKTRKRPSVSESADSYTDTSESGSDAAASVKASKPRKTRKRPLADASESTSTDSSSDVLDSGSAAVSGKTTKLKTRKRPTVSSESTSLESSADGSDSAAVSGKGTNPIKTRKRPTVSSEATSLESSSDGSDSGPGKTTKPTKTRKRPTVSSESTSLESSADGSDSGFAASGKVTKRTKTRKRPTGASGDASESTEGSASEAGEVSTDSSASTSSSEASADVSSTASAESSAAGSTESTSAAASTDSSAAESAPASTDSSAAGSAAESGAGSVVASTAASAAEPAASSMAGSASGSTAPVPAGTEAPAGPTMSVKDSVQLSESFGGPHGMDFSDKNLVNSGQTVSSISIYRGERLDGISLAISSPKTLTFTHGGTGGEQKTLKLGPGEYIKSMEVHWGKKSGRTRIFYVNFVTSAGNSLAGGSMTDDKSTVTAPEGFQLAGFFGKDGKEIDSLGAVWAYIELVTPAPTPAPAPVKDEDSPGTVAPADIAGSLSEVKTKENKRAVQLSDPFGGPHGEQFSDQLAVTSGMTVSSVTILAGARVDGLKLQVSAPKEMTFTHGGTGGKANTLALEPGEYITTMEAHWGQKGGHTRIFYLSLGTSKGNKVSGGSQTKEKGSLTAPKGYQLGGFFGRYGDEIDLIGAVWSSIAAVNETVSPPVSADEDIVLSQLFGGPHGNAFSDINKIKFGQTATSLTLRSNKRVDAVTLQVTSPADLTFSHGGKGGTEQTLILGSGEFINSMEAHWEKQGSHTRVFYLSFTTSEGKTISGGTKTDKTGTATAPEGFMLSGFYGRAADEVDQLGAIWTRMSAKNIELTDPSGVGNNTYGTTIRNWVGPNIGKSTDTSCYRKTADFDSSNICPLGYGKDGYDCITQCPISYPVTCGLECLPQNDDCALAVLHKIGSVVAVALNAASGGVFGQILAAYKITKWAVTCVANIVQVIRGLIFYLRYRQTSAPQDDTAELLTVAYQADVVLFDLPIAVCNCLGIPVPAGAMFADTVLIIVEGIVKQAITNGDEIISTGANVMNLLTGNEMVNKSATTVDELQDIIDKNSSCGWELKRLTDRVTRAVLKYRNVSDNVDDIRVKVYRSSIVLNDIPIVTNNCMGELLATKTEMVAYETRDLLRKTFGVIVDQLIDTGKTDMGKDVAENEYMLQVANMGLVVLSTVDPTGIAYMASQFVQPICGPTAYVGEIDDGTLFDALGLTTVDEAFAGSYGSYTHAGDGVVHIIFESVDTKDVTVVVHSGGDGYTKVDVGAGDTVTWDSTFPQLEDKTLYLDRWRPGLMGLPGKGGGSLLMWIPRSSEGGHITMHVRINPS